MSGPIDWIKSNPYTTGAIVIVGGLVFFFVLNANNSASGQSGSPIVVNTAPNPEVIAANTNLRLAELGIQNTQIQTSGSIETAKIQSDAAKYVNANETTVALNTISAQLRATESNNTSQIQIAQIGNEAAARQSEAAAQAAIAQAEYAYRAQADNIAASVQLGLDSNLLARYQSSNAVMATLDSNARQVDIAQISSDTSIAQADYAYRTQVANIAGTVQLGVDNNLLARYQSDNARLVDFDTNASNVAISNNSLEGRRIDNSTGLAISRNALEGVLSNNAATIQISQIQADTAALMSNNELALGLNTNQTNIINVDRLADSADWQTQVTRDVAAFEADTQRQVANLQSGTARTQSNNNRTSSIVSTIGSIASAAFAFFSDKRLKSDIKLEGIMSNGLNLYSYKFDPTGEYQLGYMAQEVEEQYPHHVTRHGPTGALMVRYAGL